MRVTSSRSSSVVDPVKARVFVSDSVHTRFSSHDASPTPSRLVPGKDSFQVLQLAAESLPHGMLVVNPDGAIVLVNQQIERQFGYCRNDLVGQSVDLLLPGALLGEYALHSQSFDTAPEARTMGVDQKLYGHCRDGSEFPVEITLNNMQIGQAVFVVASVVDLTARRELEQAASLAIEQKLEFEQLIADVSIKFINLPPDQVIEAIRDAVRRVAEMLDVDGCAFFRIPDGEFSSGPIAWWGRPGVVSSPLLVVKERFPWVTETV